MIKIIITRKVNNVTIKQDKISVKVEKRAIEVVRIDRVILREKTFVYHQYVAVPETRDSSGEQGQQAYDDDYFYICVARNRWARTLLMKGW